MCPANWWFIGGSRAFPFIRHSHDLDITLGPGTSYEKDVAPFLAPTPRELGIVKIDIFHAPANGFELKPHNFLLLPFYEPRIAPRPEIPEGYLRPYRREDLAAHRAAYLSAKGYLHPGPKVLYRFEMLCQFLRRPAAATAPHPLMELLADDEKALINRLHDRELAPAELDQYIESRLKRLNGRKG